MKRWVRVPIIDPVHPVTVWEHTPADYYGRGEYPRYINGIRPPYAHSEWRLIECHPKGNGQ